METNSGDKWPHITKADSSEVSDTIVVAGRKLLCLFGFTGLGLPSRFVVGNLAAGNIPDCRVLSLLRRQPDFALAQGVSPNDVVAVYYSFTPV